MICPNAKNKQCWRFGSQAELKCENAVSHEKNAGCTSNSPSCPKCVEDEDEKAKNMEILLKRLGS